MSFIENFAYIVGLFYSREVSETDWKTIIENLFFLKKNNENVILTIFETAQGNFDVGIFFVGIFAVGNFNVRKLRGDDFSPPKDISP